MALCETDNCFRLIGWHGLSSGKEYFSNWSAPYMEIDQNEYVEGEEEFDTVPDEVQEEGEEEDVGESHLSEEPRDGRLTTNDHGSIPLDDDSARPAK